MKILTHLQAVLDENRNPRFGDLRSLLAKRPIPLAKVIALYLDEVDKPSTKDEALRMWLPYIEQTLGRIKGLIIEESGDSYAPVVINLENEGVFSTPLYKAKLVNRLTQYSMHVGNASADSLFGLIKDIAKHSVQTTHEVEFGPRKRKATLTFRNQFGMITYEVMRQDRVRFYREETKALEGFLKNFTTPK